MTDKRAQEIGRSLLAAGCGWRAGMLTQNGERVHRVYEGYMWVSIDAETDDGRFDVECRHVRDDDGGPRWPDVRDAATRGVLLEIVRERWGSPALQISPRVRTKPNGCPTGEIMGWRYYVNDMQERDGEAATEEECLLAALDASREVRT